MSKYSLKVKLFLPLTLALFALIALTLSNSWQVRGMLYDARRAALADIADMSFSILANFQKKASAGSMSLDDAKSAAFAQIAAQRYGKDGYVTVIGANSAIVMHPIKPELNGKNMIDFKDAKGTPLYVNIAKTGASAEGKGFVEYWWPRPGNDVPSPKLGYVLRFQPWSIDLVVGDYVDDIESNFKANLYKSLGALFVLSLLITATTLYVARDILRGLGGEPNVAVSLAQRISEGDLQSEISLKPNDGHSLMFALNHMNGRLKTILQSVQEATENIENASNEIAQGNADLANRTENQASSLQVTASSMRDLTNTVRHNSEGAIQAAKYVSDTALTAEKSGAVVNKVVATMRSISASSSKINDIIGVIDGIAFQTNILALNAAVEAARAGEQGRGFAVVASEVRALAQRSAAAAKEIKTLISQSVQEIGVGCDLVEQAGTTMSDVVQSVQRISDLMDGIATANASQSVGIEEVNQAVVQMDEVTQQNAALVEEASAATYSMASQVAVLRKALQVFRVAA